MDIIEIQSSTNYKDSKPNEKSKRKHKTHIYSNKKKNSTHYKSFSNQSNNIIKKNLFDKVSSNKEIEINNNLCIYNPKYKKDLVDKYCIFLDKKKFKLSNNFDEKNSKKFLDKKDKCLERIIISDEIEDNDNKEIDSLKKKKKKFSTQKSMHQYFIVISNYDDDLKKNKSSNKLKNISKTKTYID